MDKQEKIERLNNSLARMKERMEDGARIGTHAFLASGGGIVSGFIEAKWPTLPNTTLPTAAFVGTGLVVGAMANVFGSAYSDHLGSIGSGILAHVIGKEAEQYFAADDDEEAD